MNVNPLKLMLGAMFSAEITLSDHPTRPPETATFETLARFLKKYDAGAEILTITPEILSKP